MQTRNTWMSHHRLDKQIMFYSYTPSLLKNEQPVNTAMQKNHEVSRSTTAWISEIRKVNLWWHKCFCSIFWCWDRTQGLMCGRQGLCHWAPTSKHVPVEGGDQGCKETQWQCLIDSWSHGTTLSKIYQSGWLSKWLIYMRNTSKM